MNKKPFFTAEELEEIKRADAELYPGSGRRRQTPEECMANVRKKLDEQALQKRRERQREYSKKFYRRHKERLRIEHRQRYQSDPEYRERCKERQRRHYAANRQKVSKRTYECTKKRMETDPEYREKHNRHKREYYKRPEVVERNIQLQAVKKAAKYKDQAAERIAYIKKRMTAYQLELTELEKMMKERDGNEKHSANGSETPGTDV